MRSNLYGFADAFQIELCAEYERKYSGDDVLMAFNNVCLHQTHTVSHIQL